jgi:Kazal-type serine protease inhibitor domain
MRNLLWIFPCLAVGLVNACGGDDTLPITIEDSGSGDVTLDQSSGKDATPEKDSSVMDASTDVTVADASDSSVLDSSVADASDASVVDASDSGGGCTTNNNCLKKEYCDKGTGNCSGKGACLAVPSLCPQIYNPVCGCDKKTYTNSCYAHAASVSVDYTGVCE